MVRAIRKLILRQGNSKARNESVNEDGVGKADGRRKTEEPLLEGRWMIHSFLFY